MLKGVFFDLYGTLLVYSDVRAAWSDWLATFQRALSSAGLDLSAKAFSRECEGFFSAPEPAFADDGLTIYERRIRDFCERFGLATGTQELRAAAGETIAAWHEYVSLDPAAHDVLGSLCREKTLALITNFDHPPHVHGLLTELGLKDYFAAVVVSAEVALKKPDPRIFQPALDRTKLSPAEIAYVGDTADDIDGATAAGMRPVLIRRDGQADGALATDYQTDQSVHPEAGPIPAGDHVTVIRDLRELLEAPFQGC